MTGFEIFIALVVVAAILLGCFLCYRLCSNEQPYDFTAAEEGRVPSGRPLDGHRNFKTRDDAYQAALRAGGGREPMYHPPHKAGGSHHFHVHGHGLVNGKNMHYNFRTPISGV